MNTLSPEYNANRKKLLSFKRVRFSYEKVENVVKPPQNPTVRNNFTSAVKMLVLVVKP